jgi:hypothetical protein
MKKEFTSYFKSLGFRVNSTKGEVFLKRDDLHFFIRLFKSEDDFENETYYFKYGVIVNSPFEASIGIFEHSSYLGRQCYGGERTDEWLTVSFSDLLGKANEIAVPWIQEMMELSNLTKHIEWRINEGIRWLEPEQFRDKEGQLCEAGNEICNLFGGQGTKISHKWVKRFHKSLAIIYNIDRKPEKALSNMQMYLEHIQGESFRAKEIEAINDKLESNVWPSNI